ncbi:MAG TPA: metallophosphoesterase family protein [Alphaproteobacteria bacterium]|nr:metallophosphoesterase family protein [Alphaproteobacteria bacterium]
MPALKPTLPPGLRVYAIGDIHGRFDLLKRVLEKIDADAKTASGPVQKIFLGDYIDRGLNSREIINYLIDWQAKEKGANAPIFLLGNHERVMLSVLKESDTVLLERWLCFGGRETMLSYGVKPSVFVESPTVALEALADKVPPAHMAFLETLKTTAEFGDYFFCHAGVRPGVPLEKQEEDDLVWIRHEFLDHGDSYGKMVVHGHSISLEAEFRPNRIGIDTGAYATGNLTALGLEGTKQWLIQTK